VVSPDKAISAVVIREDAGGAAGSRAYFVYLQRAGRKPELKAPVFSATRCESLVPVWKDVSTMEIQYSADCRIFGFRNYWYDLSEYASIRFSDPIVEVVLIRKASGSVPPST